MVYGFYEYDYLPIIKRYVIFYKGLDEKIAYEIKNVKEFYNYVMCLVEDPSLPYTIKIEYFIKCKGLKGKNVVNVSKDFFIDFFKTQKYLARHENYVFKRYFENFEENNNILLSEIDMEEKMKSLDPLEILLTKECNERLSNKFKTKLSTKEMYRIYKYLYENKNFAEIGREENVTGTSVSLSVHNALQKLKKLF